MHEVEKGRLSCDSDALQVGTGRSESIRVVKVNRHKTNHRKMRAYCILLVLIFCDFFNMFKALSFLYLRWQIWMMNIIISTYVSVNTILICRIYWELNKSSCKTEMVWYVMSIQSACISTMNGTRTVLRQNGRITGPLGILCLPDCESGRWKTVVR